MKTFLRTAVAAPLLLAVPGTSLALDTHNLYNKNQKRWAEARANQPGYEKPAWLMNLLGLDENGRVIVENDDKVETSKTKRTGDGAAE